MLRALWHRITATLRVMRGVWAVGYAEDAQALLAVYGRLDPLRRQVLLHVGRVASDPAFPLARDAVKVTAVTLGLNKPHTWDELLQTVKRQPVWAENQFRHVHALKLLHKRVPNRQMRNPDLNLLVELGYVSFMLRPRD